MEESNVTLDGHPVEPTLPENDPEIPDSTLDIIGFEANGDVSYYRIEVAGLTLHYIVDAASTVNIDSSVYEELVLNAEDDNDDEMHCWVTFKNSSSYRDAFIGRCALEESVTEHCLIDNSDICKTPVENAIVSSLKSCRIVGSSLSSVIISENAVIQNSRIDNSDITAGGASITVEESSVVETALRSGNALNVVAVKLVGCSISTEDTLSIKDVNLVKVALNVPDIKIETRFGFFTITFPKVTLHFYETASGNYAYARDFAAWTAGIDDADFNQRMLSMFMACKQYGAETAVDYAYDSAMSRIKTLKMLEQKRQQELRDVEN